MTTLLLHREGGPVELEMVDDLSEVPAFATAEEERAFWATRWAGPRLVAQLERSDGFAAEVGRD